MSFYFHYISTKGAHVKKRKKDAIIERLSERGRIVYSPKEIKKGYYFFYDGHLFNSEEAIKQAGFFYGYYDAECLYGSEDIPKIHRYTESQYMEQNGRPFVQGYHSKRPRFSRKAYKDEHLREYLIGIEAEKVDKKVLCSEVANNIYNRYGWRKEWDRSLGPFGFELVSPIYPMMDDEWLEDVTNSPVLLEHINADVNEHCGGHLTISSMEKTSIGLFRELENYIPLLYALYPERMSNTYCRARTKQEMEEEAGRLLTPNAATVANDKYKSILIKTDRLLEFRIFPAVTNVEQLKWRIDLLKLFISLGKQTPYYIARALSNEKHSLYLHLRKILSKQNIEKKASLYIGLYKLFGDGKLSDRIFFKKQWNAELSELKTTNPILYNFLVNFEQPSMSGGWHTVEGIATGARVDEADIQALGTRVVPVPATQYQRHVQQQRRRPALGTIDEIFQVNPFGNEQS